MLRISNPSLHNPLLYCWEKSKESRISLFDWLIHIVKQKTSPHPPKLPHTALCQIDREKGICAPIHV